MLNIQKEKKSTALNDDENYHYDKYSSTINFPNLNLSDSSEDEEHENSNQSTQKLPIIGDQTFKNFLKSKSGKTKNAKEALLKKKENNDENYNSFISSSTPMLNTPLSKSKQQSQSHQKPYIPQYIPVQPIFQAPYQASQASQFYQSSSSPRASPQHMPESTVFQNQYDKLLKLLQEQTGLNSTLRKENHNLKKENEKLRITNSDLEKEINYCKLTEGNGNKILGEQQFGHSKYHNLQMKAVESENRVSLQNVVKNIMNVLNAKFDSLKDYIKFIKYDVFQFIKNIHSILHENDNEVLDFNDIEKMNSCFNSMLKEVKDLKKFVD